MILHAILSSMPTRWLAQFNSAGSTFNFIALVVVIIMIPAGTDRTERGLPRFAPSSEVWGTIYEGTSFPAGISVLMSFIGVIWTMSGYDSPFHLAEECSNANIASPRAIVLTSATGGIFGWFLQLVVAYTVVDIDLVLDSELGQPFAAYLMQCMSQKMTLAILALTIIAGFSMGQGCMIAASRVTFAYARDDCFPLSKYWKRVNQHTQTPANAVWFNCAVGILCLLLIFGGELAVGALFSIGAIAAFVAFTIPIFIRVFFVGNRFRPGPWNLGKYSSAIGSVACVFVLLMIPILCFPSITGADLTVADMNWTCVVYGGPMLLVTIWWFVSAHKWFKGPKVNIEHMMLGREEAVVVGQGSVDGKDGDSSLGDVKAPEKITKS
ncbi:putative amino-acid permease [Alternaria gaisen]|uniref:Amino-acid permease n=1 Tax=Alternaria gaisen TaxID=167740 RepID=A0ACB6FR48_9PLEO|nr:putative amino-acid permease [Alternaria gaisen]